MKQQGAVRSLPLSASIVEANNLMLLLTLGGTIVSLLVVVALAFYIARRLDNKLVRAFAILLAYGLMAMALGVGSVLLYNLRDALKF